MPADFRRSKEKKEILRRRGEEHKQHCCIDSTRFVSQAARDVAGGRPPFCLFLTFSVVVAIPCHQSMGLPSCDLEAISAESVSTKSRSNTCTRIQFLHTFYGSAGTVQNDECVPVTALDERNVFFCALEQKVLIFWNSGLT